MNKWIVHLSMIGILLLGACTSPQEEIKITDKGFAKTLTVQKVVDDSSNEKLTKDIVDSSKIKETLELFEGLKVKKVKNDEVLGMMKSQDTYMFAFLKTDTLPGDKVPFAVNILEDGTFIFTHDGVDSLSEAPLITTNVHKKLLIRIKENLGIGF